MKNAKILRRRKKEKGRRGNLHFKLLIFGCISTFLFFFIFAPLSAAQTGGTFAIEKSAIAVGGGTIAGGTFTVESTVGQTVAGGSLQSSAHNLSSGFWTLTLAPTAALVTVSGKVSTPTGAGLFNAIVTMTDMRGNVWSRRTTSFGFFRFDEVEVGQTYIFSVNSKRYRFAPQVVNVFEEIGELNFTAEF